MKRLVFLLAVSIALTSLAWPLLNHTQAQSPTATPAVVLPTAEPACRLYQVAGENVPVQACAAANCGVVTTLASGTEICVRGETDNPGWLYIDLAPLDSTSPLYFVNGSQLQQNADSRPGAICQSWLVSGDKANIYQCPQDSCPILGTLAFEDYACGVPGTGQYAGWLEITETDPLFLSGWGRLSDFRAGRSNQGIIFPTPTGTRQSSLLPNPTSTRSLPTVTPEGPLVKTGNMPLCQQYRVMVARAVVRTCAGVGCDAVDVVTEGAILCVRGRTMNPDWLLVDLNPEDGSAPLYAISADSLAAGQQVAPAERPYCDIWEVTSTVNVRVRQCPSLTCPVVDALAPGEWLCVFEYGGQFSEWLQGDIPNGATGVWVNSTALRQRVDLEGNTPTPSPTLSNDQLTALPTGTLAATPTPIAFISATLTFTPSADSIVTSTPTPIATQNDGQSNLDVLLSALRVNNFTLRSPIASTNFSFRIPDNWTPDGNNVLLLNLEYAEELVAEAANSDLATFLNIFMDDVLIADLRLNASTVGNQTLEIPLPNDRLNNPNRRRHSISFELRAEDHCELNSESELFIRSDQSFFRFQFSRNAPTLDLAIYPRPFYNSPMPGEVESVVVVLPPDPTDADLEAGASVVSGLGLLTANNVTITTVTADSITPDQRTTQHLLLIGTPQDNPLIAELYSQALLPTTRAEDGTLAFGGQPILETDGVVQIIQHPDQPLKAILIATGQSALGVTKAAKALGGPPSVMRIGGQVTIISDTLTAGHQTIQYQTDKTFAELGFEQTLLNGVGQQVAEISFPIPSGYTLTDQAYVELRYNFSELIGTGETTLNLVMNDETPIGSRLLRAEDASVGPQVLRVWIPKTAIVPGQVNILSIIIDVRGDWECNPPENDIAWFTIDPQSLLSLPIELINPQMQLTYVGEFPAPFNERVDLSNLWISLPDDPTAADIEQAMQLVAYLAADNFDGEGMQPIVRRGELPDGTDLAAYHFLVIGRPTTNRFLERLNPSLPQPFVPQTDQLQQVLDDVVYRLPEGYGVGVLQVLRSPWEANKRILVITGTTTDFQAIAAQALYGERYAASELNGNVIFVNPNAVTAIDTTQLQWVTQVLQEGIPLLETQTALNQNQTPVPFSSGFTSTPGPTFTPSITPSPAPTDSPTPIFTQTPTTVPPSPFPTFAPLGEEQISPVTVQPPAWVDILIVITVAVIGLAVLFGLFQWIRWYRTRNR